MVIIDVDISDFKVVESKTVFRDGDEKYPPIAIDERLDLYTNGKLYTMLVLTSAHIEETVLGVLIGDGLVSSLSDIEKIDFDLESRITQVYLKVNIEPKRLFVEDCALLAAKGLIVNSNLKVSWKTIVDIFLDFNRRTISITKGLAMHTSGIYDLVNRRAIIAHDVSRHTSIAKLVGLAVTHNIATENSIVITTGRASSDMVIRSANIKVPIVISTRGPLYSGLTAASMLRVTLISYIRRGDAIRGLRVLTYPERIIDYSKNS